MHRKQSENPLKSQLEIVKVETGLIGVENKHKVMFTVDVD